MSMENDDKVLSIKDNKTLIDRIRLKVLTSAELFDAWRVVPRLLVAAYGWLCWEIVAWYMDLKPAIIAGCDIQTLGELCLYDAPTTQHAALVTVMVGAAAAVFGFYTNTGRSWTTGGFVKWDETHTQTQNRDRYELPRMPDTNRYTQNRNDRRTQRRSQQPDSRYTQSQNEFDATQPIDDEGFWE